MARITSFTPPRAMRSVSRSIFRSEGEIPCMGEMTPPSTWYNPLYCRVFSTDSTSATCSTTQIVVWSRSSSAQIGQTSSLHPQDVDGQAQRRTAPYAREFRQLADNVL